MNKKFCSKCNGATFFEDEVPNVCSKCGQSFAGFVVSQIKIEPITTRPKPRIDNRNLSPQRKRLLEAGYKIQEQEEDNQEFPETDMNFENLKIELEDIPKRSKNILSSLVVDRSAKENIIRPKLKEMDEAEIRKEWAKDVQKTESKEII